MSTSNTTFIQLAQTVDSLKLGMMHWILVAGPGNMVEFNDHVNMHLFMMVLRKFSSI